MRDTLSGWAAEFLHEVRVAVISTLNKDGSPHVTAVWYALADDGTLIVTTQAISHKLKNLRRDPRIALCIGDMGRSVSLYGHVSIIEDEAVIRQDIERIAERYVQDASIRSRVIANLLQRSPLALHFRPEKITEFSTEHTGSSIMS